MAPYGPYIGLWGVKTLRGTSATRIRCICVLRVDLGGVQPCQGQGVKGVRPEPLMDFFDYFLFDPT